MPWALGINAEKTIDEDECAATAFVDLIESLGPEAWWPLDETAGTTAHDISGNGHHGTYESGNLLAQRDGPCSAHKYVNCRPASSFGQAVTVPDSSAFSPPNDLTVVAATSYIGAFGPPGATQANITPVIKLNEWYASQQLRTQDLLMYSNASPPGSGAFYEKFQTTVGGQIFGLGLNWYLAIWRFPADAFATEPTMFASNVERGNSVAGPGPATRVGNTSSDLWLGLRSTAIGSPGPSHGIFLSNVAIYTRLLDDSDIDDLWTAWQADGWDLA